VDGHQVGEQVVGDGDGFVAVVGGRAGLHAVEGPLRELAGFDPLAHPAAGTGVDQVALEHLRDFHVDQPRAAHRSHPARELAEEHGGEAGQAAFHIMLKDDIRLADAVLRADERRRVRNLDGHRAQGQAGGIVDGQAGQRVDARREAVRADPAFRRRAGGRRGQGGGGGHGDRRRRGEQPGQARRDAGHEQQAGQQQ